VADQHQAEEEVTARVAALLCLVLAARTGHPSHRYRWARLRGADVRQLHDHLSFLLMSAKMQKCLRQDLTDSAVRCIWIREVQEPEAFRPASIFVCDETELENSTNRSKDADELFFRDCESNVANEDGGAWLRRHYESKRYWIEITTASRESL
jgi:hypothetical protein